MTVDPTKDWGGKRYHAFSRYLRMKHGERVWKVALDAGMTCPNRDGAVGTGGCVYCRREAHSPQGRTPPPINEQIAKGIERLRGIRSAERFIIYFQSGTNTYAPVEDLQALFGTIREFGGVVGMAVGTRPDCLGDDVLDVLTEFTSDYEVWLELGLQSSNDETLRAINRGHDLDTFLDAFQRVRRYPLNICVHLIFGLPGEDRETMLSTIRLLSGLHPEGVKIHPLQVLRGTKLEEAFSKGDLNLLPMSEFVEIVCDALELLPRETTIQRLTAEAPADQLISPKWCSDKNALLNAIESELEKRNSRQGLKYSQ